MVAICSFGYSQVTLMVTEVLEEGLMVSRMLISSYLTPHRVTMRPLDGENVGRHRLIKLPLALSMFNVGTF